jgi:hypothetical protein
MATRCPDCHKFVSLDTDTDPELNGIEIDDDGLISAEVRIVNTCAECGTDSGETPDDVQEHIDKCHDDDNPPDWIVEENIVERDDAKRGGKNHYGFYLSYTVRCSCDKTVNLDGAVIEGTFSTEHEMADSVTGGEMEDIT